MIEVHVHGPESENKDRVIHFLSYLVDTPLKVNVTNVGSDKGKSVHYKLSGQHAMHDYSLPAFVRAHLVLLDLPATESMIMREANMFPALYAKKDGRPCRVTILSTFGDIGIAWDLNKSIGYDERGLSIYDLADFTQTPPG